MAFEQEVPETIYQANGYEDRVEYLECLSTDYGIDFGAVDALSEMMGPQEDFDGLICALEDEF